MTIQIEQFLSAVGMNLFDLTLMTFVSLSLSFIQMLKFSHFYLFIQMKLPVYIEYILFFSPDFCFHIYLHRIECLYAVVRGTVSLHLYVHTKKTY